MVGMCRAVTIPSGAIPAQAAARSSRQPGSDGQRLRRGDGGTDHLAGGIAVEPHLDDPGDLLEAQQPGRGAAAHHEAGAQLRVAGEGQLSGAWKMRRGRVRRVGGGRTKVVSERFSSAASACISASEIPRASGKTASWLPPNCRSVKTSTVTKG